MSLIIKNISIITPKNPQKYSGKYDVLIENKKISKISRKVLKKTDKIFDGSGYYLCPGFVDLHCHLRDPGFTHKEDLISGGKAALAGGFTTICSVANTKPTLDNPQLIKDFIKRGKEANGPTIYPYSSITKGLLGKELVDFEENLKAGAISFSDDGVFLKNENFLMRALEFSRNHNIRISLHEELNSDIRTSEFLAIKRDLEILKKVGGRMHFMHVSTKESCVLIEDAKNKGLDITCEVTPHHLVLCEDNTHLNDTNAKCNPPVRKKEDVTSLLDALNRNIIDAVATDHAPHTKEEKNCLYQNAPNGIIGFQTALSILLELVLNEKLTLNRAIESLTEGPSKVFGLKNKGVIKEGEDANLVILSLDKEYVFEEKLILSKGKNSPFIGKTFTGGPKATIHEGNIKYFSEML